MHRRSLHRIHHRLLLRYDASGAIRKSQPELALPDYVHVTGIESIFSGTPTLSMGVADSYIERYAAVPQVGMASVAGLILSGTSSNSLR